jgi:hypothetical protein
MTARIDGIPVVLMDIPDHVRNMCLIDKDGYIPAVVTGVNAKRALHAYLQWAQTQGLSLTKALKLGDQIRVGKKLEILYLGKNDPLYKGD